MILSVWLRVPFRPTTFQKERIEAAIRKITEVTFPRSSLAFYVETSYGDLRREGVSGTCVASGGVPQDQIDLQHALRLALHGLGRDGFEEFSNMTLHLSNVLGHQTA